KFEHIVDSDIIDFVEQSLLMNGLPLLAESVYIENVFSSQHEDRSKLSKSKRYWYNKQGQSLENFLFKNCHLTKSNFNKSIHDLKFHLEESNVYFQNNKFYGTLLNYSALEGLKVVFKLEVIMTTSKDDTLLVPTTLKPKLKSIKVKVTIEPISL